jgi:hypothetical protein
LAGTGRAPPEPAHAVEERILLVQGATASNLHHDPHLALALLHIAVLEAVQAAGVLEGGACAAHLSAPAPWEVAGIFMRKKSRI